MKFISYADSFEVLPDNTYNINDHLDPGVYSIDLKSPLTNELILHVIKTWDYSLPKIYGSIPKKVDKTFNAYNVHNRKIGVLLSGTKGTGKSLMIRKIISDAVHIYKLPVFVVNNNLSNITDFLRKIDDPYVLVIDEFEKKFKYRDYDNEETEVDDQSQFLNFLDGESAGGKALTVVAVNYTSNLTRYLIDRPGRFRYNFKFDYLKPEIIKEFCRDNLLTHNKEAMINELSSYGSNLNLTFDSLATIVEELNSGYSLKETLDDINYDILSLSNNFFEIHFVFSNPKLPNIVTKAKVNWSQQILEVQFNLNDFCKSFKCDITESDLNTDLIDAYTYKVNISGTDIKFTDDKLVISGSKILTGGPGVCYNHSIFKADGSFDRAEDFMFNCMRHYCPELNKSEAFNFSRIELIRTNKNIYHFGASIYYKYNQ